MASARRGKGAPNRKQRDKGPGKPIKPADPRVTLPIIGNRLPLVIHWHLSATNGWGIYGSQLALQLAGDRDLRPMICSPTPIEKLAFDALRNHRVRSVWEDSAELHRQAAAFPKQTVKVNGAVLSALNDQMVGGWLGAGETDLVGSPDVAVVFIVDTNLDSAARERSKRYDLIVAGSSWNLDLLTAAGIGPVAFVLQGIDHTLFHPAPRSGVMGNRFMIFSGGKLEFRKGQDLLLRAFAAFRTRHPDAHLVTAWHSPWPALARGLSLREGVPPVPVDAEGRLDVRKWAAAFGVPPDAITDLGPVPHAQMPTLLREMDVAVFPNRCEPGTNLVAMECMACAVPVILSRNTGHLDIAFDDCTYALTHQGQIAPIPQLARGTDGWGESDVDEILEALESVWRDREESVRRGLLGAERMAKLSWSNQVGQLKQALLPYMRKAP